MCSGDANERCAYTVQQEELELLAQARLHALHDCLADNVVSVLCAPQAASLRRCLWAWARGACATCLPPPRRPRPASSSSTRSTQLVGRPARPRHLSAVGALHLQRPALRLWQVHPHMCLSGGAGALASFLMDLANTTAT